MLRFFSLFACAGFLGLCVGNFIRDVNQKLQAEVQPPQTLVGAIEAAADLAFTARSQANQAITEPGPDNDINELQDKFAPGEIEYQILQRIRVKVAAARLAAKTCQLDLEELAACLSNP